MTQAPKNGPISLRMEGARHGIPLVLANSLAATSDMWDGQAAALGLARPVIRIDYPGHNAAPDDTTFDSVAGLADALLDALSMQGVQQFDLAGISLGALIGLQIASSQPHRLRRLMASNFRPFQSEASAGAWDTRIALVGVQGTGAIVDGTLERWMPSTPGPDSGALAAAFRQMIGSTTQAGYIAAATAVRDFDFRNRQGPLPCQVLLAASTGDEAAPAGLVQALAAPLQAQLVLFDTTAHIPNCALPTAYLQAMQGFFD